MNNMITITIPYFLIILFFFSNTSIIFSQTLKVNGLDKPAEILVDHWGVPHIYAQTEHDLFFTQGWNAARDRLFQLEIWRRQATGTVAEIMGLKELKRDIGTRLFKYRGDLDQEFNYYHPRGKGIITAYTEGINAFITAILTQPDQLPVEFKLLGIKPELWTPEVVISRHQGLLGNVDEELNTGRLVALLGQDVTHNLNNFHPHKPDLTLQADIDTTILFADILELYHAYRRPVRFTSENIVSSVDKNRQEENIWSYNELKSEEGKFDIGSNNWVVQGNKTSSGYPMLANDPHRAQSAPSLRYIAHLIGPGWNVIGGGEPSIPGISIGHNAHGAWGLTIFSTDGEDLYFYKTHPQNSNLYWHKGQWWPFLSIVDTIPVKDMAPQIVTYKYSVHGPVIYEDTLRRGAVAMRCAWLEPGGSPYLGSLSMGQAEDFDAFRAACTKSNIPGENMVWADPKGTIGWQAVGIAPVRRSFSGMVPLPGDGRFEWDGYLPIKSRPWVKNPAEGYFITANENVTPSDYPLPEALGYEWADPYRGDRIAELIGSGRKLTMTDMAEIQTDYLSIPARTIIPMLKNLQSQGLEDEIKLLLAWDYKMTVNSTAAGLYNQWEKEIAQAMRQLMVPAPALPYINTLDQSKIIQWLIFPDGKFGPDPLRGRNELLIISLEKAVNTMKTRFGPDKSKWQYGQNSYKHALLHHPLSGAVRADIKKKLEVGPAPRGGSGSTVGNSGNADNQLSGASFKFIVDTRHWDECWSMNNPGQSGNPDSPFYKNLFELWATDQYFPLYFSRQKIESVLSFRLELNAGLK